MLSRIKFLTPATRAAMICTVADTVATGIGTPDSKGVRTPVKGVFLCPSFRQVFSLAYSVMAGCSGQPRGWPEPLPGSSNPLQPATQSLEPLRGGLSLEVKDKSL